jgi:hypothetical protein
VALSGPPAGRLTQCRGRRPLAAPGMGGGISRPTVSKQALATANQSGSLRLVLIDGEALTKLIIRFNVGVRVARAAELKRIDLDYFEDAATE